MYISTLMQVGMTTQYKPTCVHTSDQEGQQSQGFALVTLRKSEMKECSFTDNEL